MESQGISRAEGLAMSTFFVMPSRHQLGRQFAEVLGMLFPGLNWPCSAWPDLAEVLGGTTASHLDVYVVYREDLPEGVVSPETLSGACGAEQGDEVIEVQLGTRLADLAVQRWRLEGPEKAAA
jgi:hypothetical protein